MKEQGKWKGGVCTGTWCILHGDHQSLVLQEVLIVLDDVGVVQQLQHLALVLGCKPFVTGHLLHRDLLQDHQGAISPTPAEVNNPERRK